MKETEFKAFLGQLSDDKLQDFATGLTNQLEWIRNEIEFRAIINAPAVTEHDTPLEHDYD